MKILVISKKYLQSYDKAFNSRIRKAITPQKYLSFLLHFSNKLESFTGCVEFLAKTEGRIVCVILKYSTVLKAFKFNGGSLG